MTKSSKNCSENQGKSLDLSDTLQVDEKNVFSEISFVSAELQLV